MKGVETRIAPPTMAIRTMRRLIAHVRSAAPWPLEDLEAAVERLGDEQHHEDEALQHQHGGVGQVHAALDQAAGGDDAAEHDGDRNDRERVVPRQEGDEDAGEAVAGDQRGIGAAVDGRDLEEAGEAGAGAGDHAADDDQLADRQALRQRGARIAAGDAGGEAEGRARHQDIEHDRQQRCRPRGPNARRCRESCRSCRRRRSAWSRACSEARSRSAPSTKKFMMAMAM